MVEVSLHYMLSMLEIHAKMENKIVRSYFELKLQYALILYIANTKLSENSTWVGYCVIDGCDIYYSLQEFQVGSDQGLGWELSCPSL